MREQFIGYFDPKPENVSRLWKTALISLDTNVLLGLYRMPSKSRGEMIDLLQSVKERLWVPYHVLVEYHANRLDVLREEYQNATKLEKDFRSAFQQFKAVVKTEGNERRECWAEVSRQLTEIERSVNGLFEAAKVEGTHYIAPNQKDTIRDFIEELLTGRVGERPVDQEALNADEEEAAKRFANGIGPGFRDEKKAGEKRLMDGLIYDRQYGDYMVWSQLLKRCMDENVRAVIFVTSDVKEDWWLETKSISGKRPQPELVMEMSRVANVKDFEMHTFAQFAESARQHLQAKVQQSTIEDAQKAEEELRKEYSVSVRKRFETLKRSLEKGGYRSGKTTAKMLPNKSADIAEILRHVSRVPLGAGAEGGVGISFDDEGQPVAALVLTLTSFVKDERGSIGPLFSQLAPYDISGGVDIYLLTRGGSTSSAPASTHFGDHVRSVVREFDSTVVNVRVWIGGSDSKSGAAMRFNLV